MLPNLGFTEEWLRLGIVTPAQIAEAIQTFEQSDDKHSEHYRYKAFRDFLNRHRPLPPDLAIQLFELGDKDPDYSMGGAVMADILLRPECPPEVVEKSARSGRKHLVKMVAKRRAQDERDH